MTTRDDRHRASLALVLLFALACLLLASVGTASADARRPREQRVDQRCTPKGVNALRGTARLERKVRCLINRRRVRRGLAPLRYNRCLDRAAERHVRDMVRHRYFAHSSRRGGTPGQRARAAGYPPRAGGWSVAENLGWGMGRSASPHLIVRAWLRSPGHRANIFLRRHRDVAVAVLPGAPVRDARSSSRASATYVVTFGSRQRAGRCGGKR